MVVEEDDSDDIRLIVRVDVIFALVCAVGSAIRLCVCFVNVDCGIVVDVASSSVQVFGGSPDADAVRQFKVYQI